MKRRKPAVPAPNSNSCMVSEALNNSIPDRNQLNLNSSSSTDPYSLLSSELLAKAQSKQGSLSSVDNGSNALIITSSSSPHPNADLPPVPQKKLTHQQERKLLKLAETKEKKEKAARLYASLAKTQLTPEQQQLLLSTGEMGQKPTHKQKIQRLFRKQQAGIRQTHRETETTKKQEQDTENSKMFKHRRISPSSSSLSSSPSSSSSVGFVTGYGLQPNRWRGESSAEGYVKFDTYREISYGSADEDEDESDNGAEDDDEDHNNGGTDVAADEQRETEDLKTTSEKNDESAAGIFSVSFDVIQTSNRPKRQRKTLILPSQQQQQPSLMSTEAAQHQIDSGIIVDQQDDREKKFDDSNVDFMTSSPSSHLNSWFQAHLNSPFPSVIEARKLADECHLSYEDVSHWFSEARTNQLKKLFHQSEEATSKTHSDNDEDENISIVSHPYSHEIESMQDDAVESTHAVISVRGKAKFQPVSSSASSVQPDSGASVSAGVKFIRAVRTPLSRLPLPSDRQLYIPNDAPIRVSFNDERMGETGGPADTDELEKRKKGEAIIENNESQDDKPLLYTRRLPQTDSASSSSLFVTYVNRLSHLQQSRLSLPITSHEQEIIEALNQHNIVIIQGETGSGKTTQVPQFLLENGWGFGDKNGMIGVTQPRRVAAITTSQRVAAELNLPSTAPTQFHFNPSSVKQKLQSLRESRIARGESVEEGEITVYPPYGTVSYQVRYDTTVSSDTRIKFMTDGVLLREISGDFLLQKYSCIIIDEAHERGRNTDVLIGLVSRSVKMREKLYNQWKQKQRQNGHSGSDSHNDKNECMDDTNPEQLVIRSPLKLIIMSATLRVSDFTSNTSLFPISPPLMTIPARQHKVTVHFSRRTPLDNYLPAMLVKVMKMHVKLPPGGILVFLSGRDEIEYMCDQVNKVWNEREKRKRKVQLLTEDEDGEKNEKRVENSLLIPSKDEPKEQYEFDLGDDDTSEEDVNDKDREEEKHLDDVLEQDKEAAEVQKEEDLNALFSSRHSSVSSAIPLLPYCLPLYSLLPSHLQLRVFSPPPVGHRLIVFSTNVAETSLTIPDITYVLDSGREKRKVWDRITGASHFTVDWISQASAEQRKGRAGRTGPGHVYRLYSAAVHHNLFQPHQQPEILREPIETTVLQMKAMGIQHIQSFPFPTPPEAAAVKQALIVLTQLGALTTTNQQITSLGSTLSLFPVLPRYAKMLVLAHQGGCLPYIIAIVAAVSVEQILLRIKMKDGTENNEDENENADYDDDDDDVDMDIITRDRKAMEKEAKKKKRKELYERLQQARQRWTRPDSDLLTYLRIIGGYEYATMQHGKENRQQKQRRHQLSSSTTESHGKKHLAAVEFCRVNFVRLKAMEEVEELRQQLTRIAINIIEGQRATTITTGEARSLGDEEEEEEEQKQLSCAGLTDSPNKDLIHQLVHPMVPPTPVQERLIRQLICAGLMDRVARKMTEEQIRALIEKKVVPMGANLSGAYELLNSPHPAFIHPTSVLFPSTAQPYYVLYHSLQISNSNKQYLHDCTMIEESTLIRVGSSAGLVSWSSWLESPAAIYNSETDQIEGWKRATFGPSRWSMSLQRRSWSSTDDGIDRQWEYKHFCRLLLTGEIFQQLKFFLPYLSAKPTHLCQTGSLLKEKFMAIVRKCQFDEIHSKKQLKTKFLQNAQYLYKEVEPWIQSIKQVEFKAMWPPTK